MRTVMKLRDMIEPKKERCGDFNLTYTFTEGRVIAYSYHTGKKLFDTYSYRKHKAEKYYDCDVVEIYPKLISEDELGYMQRLSVVTVMRIRDYTFDDEGRLVPIK